MMDEETFMDEVEAMERALYRVSRSLLKSPEDCADAVQEALARAWARRGRVDADYFRPWLMRILINECHTIGRKRRRVHRYRRRSSLRVRCRDWRCAT